MSDSLQDGRGQAFGDAAAVRQAPLVALWRHKYIVIATVLIFAGVTAFLSKAVLEKEYEATATMWVTQTHDTQSFDAVSAVSKFAVAAPLATTVPFCA